jgi:hypothetical protein
MGHVIIHSTIDSLAVSTLDQPKSRPTSFCPGILGPAYPLIPRKRWLQVVCYLWGPRHQHDNNCSLSQSARQSDDTESDRRSRTLRSLVAHKRDATSARVNWGTMLISHGPWQMQELAWPHSPTNRLFDHAELQELALDGNYWYYWASWASWATAKRLKRGF